MATFRFLTYKPKKATHNCFVFVRFSHGTDIQLEAKTTIQLTDHRLLKKGKLVKSDDFDNRPYVEQKLDKLKLFLKSKAAERQNEQIGFTKEWLNDLLDEHFPERRSKKASEPTLLEAFKRFMHDKAENKRASTWKTFNTTVSRLEEYERWTKEYKVYDVNEKWVEGFTKWMKRTKQLDFSSYQKTLKQTGEVLRYVDGKDGFRVHQDVLTTSKLFSPETPKNEIEVDVFALSETEVQKIFSFEGTEAQNRIRDWFIIGYYSASRVEDFLNFDFKEVRPVSNRPDLRIINYTQDKGQKRVAPFIKAEALEVLKRHNGFPTKIHQSHYTTEIKKIARKVGITEKIEGAKKVSQLIPVIPEGKTRKDYDKAPGDYLKKGQRKKIGLFAKCELIASHTCRRSWATINYHKENAMPLDQIRKQLGHTKDSQTLAYIGMPSDAQREKDSSHF
jgi:hypothetical protein